MLEVKNLSVAVGDRELIHNLSFRVLKNQTTLLLGPNGAGKSTFAGALAGLPKYKITSGEILYRKENLTPLSPDARTRRGLFLSFQTPVEIPGISTKELLHSALEQGQKLNGPTLEHSQNPATSAPGRQKSLTNSDFESRLAYARDLLKLDPFFESRDLNVGLSGGEKKKNEIFQLLTLRPSLAILDEIDSGLDPDSAKLISKALAQYQKDYGCTYIIITHNFQLLGHLTPNQTLVLDQGRLAHTGDESLATKIQEQGFEAVLSVSASKSALKKDQKNARP